MAILIVLLGFLNRGPSSRMCCVTSRWQRELSSRRAERVPALRKRADLLRRHVRAVEPQKQGDCKRY